MDITTLLVLSSLNKSWIFSLTWQAPRFGLLACYQRHEDILFLVGNRRFVHREWMYEVCSRVSLRLRHHGPLHGDRDTSHTLAARLSENDIEIPVEIKRGDVTVHHERTLHGSGGNFSASSWRRAWVIAFRSASTVAEERAIGFTHSHNDSLHVLNKVGIEGEEGWPLDDHGNEFDLDGIDFVLCVCFKLQ